MTEIGSVLVDLGDLKNCSQDISSCEDNSWLLGAKGDCDIFSGLCICPEGFNGLDDWETFNSCNVNIELNRRLKIAMAAINALDILICFVCLLYVVNFWGRSLCIIYELQSGFV